MVDKKAGIAGVTVGGKVDTAAEADRVAAGTTQRLQGRQLRGCRSRSGGIVVVDNIAGKTECIELRRSIVVEVEMFLGLREF